MCPWDFPATSPAIQVGQLLIDWDRGIVSVDGQRVDLTKNELTLLTTLATAQGRILSHGWLLDTIWTDKEINVGADCLKVAVCSLRVKLGSERWRLKTVRGLGYRLETEADRRLKSTSKRGASQQRRRED